MDREDAYIADSYTTELIDQIEILQQENREMREVLGRAKEIVEDYPKRCTYIGPEAKVDGGWEVEFVCCNWCGESADSKTKIVHTKDCLATIAAALLPDLEKWAGKEGRGMTYLQCEKCLMESSNCVCEEDIRNGTEDNPVILQAQLNSEKKKVENLIYLVQKLSKHNIKLQAQLDAQAKELALAKELLQRVTWRTKIHLSDCICADCEAVEAFLSTKESKNGL